MSARSLRRRLTPLVVTGTMMLGVATAAIAPAGAATPDHSAAKVKVYGSSLTGSVTVKSSTHKKLTLTVAGSKFREGNGDARFVQLTATNGTESHEWGFPVHKDSVKANHGTGSITLSKKLTHGYAVVKLTFARVGNSTGNNCMRTTSSKVTGVLYLNTKSAWGRLGSKSQQVKFKGAEADFLDGACGGGGSSPCDYAVSWEAQPKHGTSFFYGESHGHKSYVTAERSKQLGKWGYRFDSVTARTKRPILHGSWANKEFTVKGSGLSHGKIVLTALDRPSQATMKCERHGQKTTETRYSWSDLKMSGHMTVHAQIYGSLKVKALSGASFMVVKFS